MHPLSIPTLAHLPPLFFHGERFTNLRFTVKDGAGLIFDFAKTEFGPNLGYVRQLDVLPAAYRK